MGDGSMIRFACVLAMGGLAGVFASARGVGQAVAPPGTVAQPPQNAVEPPKPVAKTPKKPAERTKKAARHPKSLTNSIGMQFMLIPAGEFLMGSPAWDKDGQEDERPQHRVRITSPFYLDIYEVTQQEYQRVVGANPSSEQLSPQQPVETVSWFDAVQFCNRLSEREKVRPYYEVSGEKVTIVGGNGYRLPTEAEWEYACRAGTTTKWSCGDDVQQLELYAWYKGNAGSHSRLVGEKAPNAFGLFDMHGHMWEWCWDRYGEDYYQHSPVVDPQGPSSGSLRIERGGDGWNNDPQHLRSAYRNHQFPSSRFRDVGFRVARTSNEPPLEPVVEADGKQDSPAEILEKRGLVCLRGTPPTWILREEADVLGRNRLVQAQAARLNWGREQLQRLAEASQSRQAFIAARQAQRDLLEAGITEIDRILPDNPFIGSGIAAQYHNLLIEQHNAMVGEQRRLGTMISSFYQEGGDFQEQLRQFGKEVEKLEKSHGQTVEELRDSVAEINKRYEELGADKEIAKALSDLSEMRKAKQRLGPSRKLKDATKAVTRAAGSNRAGTPTRQGRKKN